MIKSISFKNYKAFKTKQKLEIKPLTILVGPNNAGKTSITDLLLLLKQSTSGKYQPHSFLVTDGEEGIEGPLERMINIGDNNFEIMIDIESFTFTGERLSRKSDSMKYLEKLTNCPSYAKPSKILSFFPKKDNKISLNFSLTKNVITKRGKQDRIEMPQKITIKNGKLNGFSLEFIFDSDDSHEALRSGMNIGMENIARVLYSKTILQKIMSNNFHIMDKIFDLFENAFNYSSINRAGIKSDFHEYFGGWEDTTRSGDGMLKYINPVWFTEDARYEDLFIKMESHKGNKVVGWMEPFIRRYSFTSADNTKNDGFYFRSDRNYNRTFDNIKNNQDLYHRFVLEFETFRELLRAKKTKKLSKKDKSIIIDAVCNMLTAQFKASFKILDEIINNSLKNYSNIFDGFFSKVNLIDIRKNEVTASYKRNDLIKLFGKAALLFTDKLSIPLSKTQRVYGLKERNVRINEKILMNAVNKDLQSIGINYKVSLKRNRSNFMMLDQIEERFLFLFKTPNGAILGIHEVGYGLSQLIPLLIRKNYFSLLNKKGGATTIIREPEANIHPSLQSRIAENLISTTSNPGNSIIVETHSEHFIRGIQIAVAKGSIKSSDVNIIYVNQTKTGKSSLKKIELEEKGKFKSDYPKGFFESGFKEVVELQKLQKP